MEVYSGKGWPEVQRWLGQKWNGGGGDTKITKKKKKEREIIWGKKTFYQMKIQFKT